MSYFTAFVVGYDPLIGDFILGLMMTALTAMYGERRS